ncbi:Spx/MgsR family RNA polymerase-binding regulatory protein [Sphaerotilus natans]|uniref:Spx/MgsR family RNA polymerase-binding regulatory protein n=1 Tax=Sphaerotilus natans TaxID=34103 RepID=UPI00406C99ED
MMQNPALRVLTLHGIPNCDTVKKARAWLAAQAPAAGVDVLFHDFRKQGVPAELLAQAAQALGWERLINRSGTTWRRLDETERTAVVDAATATALMQAQPSVIRRPLVRWPDGRFSVGFDAADFAARLAR